MDSKKLSIFAGVLFSTVIFANAQQGSGIGLNATTPPITGSNSTTGGSTSTTTCASCMPLLPNNTAVITSVLAFQEELTLISNSVYGSTKKVNFNVVAIVAACQNSSNGAYEIVTTIGGQTCKNPNLTFADCDKAGVGTTVTLQSCGIQAFIVSANGTNATTAAHTTANGTATTSPPTTSGQSTSPAGGPNTPPVGQTSTSAESQSTPTGGQSTSTEGHSAPTGGQSSAGSPNGTLAGAQTTTTPSTRGSSSGIVQLQFTCWSQYIP